RGGGARTPAGRRRRGRRPRRGPRADRRLPQGRARRRRPGAGHPRPLRLVAPAPAGARHDRRRQPRQPGGPAARGRERPGAQADRGAAGGERGAVPAAACTRAAGRGLRRMRPAVRIEPSWREQVGAWFEREDMRGLSAFLQERRRAGARIYPPGGEIFAAFAATPFDQVRVVVLGQDPYHGPGQAHGLCFSVRPGVPVPPSLDNIFKELGRDLGLPRPDHGCLLPWARRGVLLLNAVLTVEEGRPGAHQGRGWEGFTDHVVDVLNRRREGLVFMLWGAYAQAKGRVIDARRHRVL